MLKILVAEDDVSTNKLLCAILKINGYEAIPAFNGEAALDIIDHQHIDLLLCDVMMPKMDGFALTQAIRDGGSMMPILMLTAKALPEDKHTGFLVGTDDYMTKPPDKTELDLSIVIEKSLVHTGQDQHRTEPQHQQHHKRQVDDQQGRQAQRLDAAAHPFRDFFHHPHTFFTARYPKPRTVWISNSGQS